MNKKYGKILLIMIIIVQLAVPVTLLVMKLVARNELREHGKDIKVSVRSIYLNEDSVSIVSDELGELDYDRDGYKYAVFEEGENGYYSHTLTDEKPSDGAYLKAGCYGNWTWYNISYRNSGITKEDIEFYGVGSTIYDADIEKENIRMGNIKGPQTEAYMIVRIYKGEYEIKEVYVDGLTLNGFFNKILNSEIDATRFEYCYDYDFYNYDYEEYYDYEYEEITEPVTYEMT